MNAGIQNQALSCEASDPTAAQLHAIRLQLSANKIEEARAQLEIFARRSCSVELQRMCDALDQILLPPESVLHLETALRKMKAGDRIGAEEAFGMARQSAPGSFQVVRRYCDSLATMGDHSQAQMLLTEQTLLHPDLAESHARLGAIFSLRGQDERAQNCFRTALHLDPEHVESIAELSECLLRSGAPAESADLARRFLELAPDHPSAPRMRTIADSVASAEGVGKNLEGCNSCDASSTGMTLKDLPIFQNPLWDLHMEQIEKERTNSLARHPGDNFRFVRKIGLELSNVCNYTNIHKLCPLHLRQEPNHVLEMSTIRKIFEELSNYEYAGQIGFNIYNEPLMDPRLFTILTLAKEYCPNCHLSLTTNGYALDQVLVDELDRLGVSLIFLSAYFKHEYARFVSYNYHNIGVFIQPMFLDGRLDIYDREPFHCKSPCGAPLNDLSINYRGEVQICCLDWAHTQIFGDLKRQSIRDIVNSSRVHEIHTQLGMGNRTLPICQRCDWSR